PNFRDIDGTQLRSGPDDHGGKRKLDADVPRRVLPEFSAAERPARIRQDLFHELVHAHGPAQARPGPTDPTYNAQLGAGNGDPTALSRTLPTGRNRLRPAYC